MQLAKLIAELEASNPISLTEQALHALSHMVVAVPPSVDQVARVLDLSRRTLVRHLAAEGTSVKTLLDDVRCELGRQLLEETSMPLSEIAATLHYSMPGAFSRAFKGWTGMTPRDCRAEATRRPLCGDFRARTDRLHLGRPRP